MRFVSRVCFNQIEPGQIQSFIAAITLLLIGLVTITLGNARKRLLKRVPQRTHGHSGEGLKVKGTHRRR